MDSTETDSSEIDATETEEAPAIRVLAGNPTPTELAAVTAVLSALAEEERDKRMPVAPAVRSGWSLSQRQLRSPIVPAPGAWVRRGL
jgi:hypothetical protein